MTSPDCAICYVSSLEYLLPSIVSAAGARNYVPAHKAQIFIFLTSTDRTRIAKINKAISHLDVVVQGFDDDAIQIMASQHFDGYITSTTLGRFFIGSLVPGYINRIIYIDGDTWVEGDISALVDASVPEGRLAAAEDIISFRCNGVTPAGQRIQSYFKGLGIERKNGYFNSGVLAVHKKTWVSLAAEAFEFFKRNRDLCNCLDQSALNAVSGDRRLKLSLKWNFQSPARFMGVEALVDPRIYHFNQYIKPWMAPSKPWQEIFTEYVEAVEPFRDLNLTLPMVSDAEISKHNRLNPVKNALLQSPILAGLSSLPTGIRQYEKDAWL